MSGMSPLSSQKQVCLQSAVQVEMQNSTGKMLTANQATVLEKEKNEKDCWDRIILRLCQKSVIQSQQSQGLVAHLYLTAKIN